MESPEKGGKRDRGGGTGGSGKGAETFPLIPGKLWKVHSNWLKTWAPGGKNFKTEKAPFFQGPNISGLGWR